jgi:two-component sensor histidine kinase
MKNELSVILDKVRALSGISPRKNETDEQAILRGLEAIEQKTIEEKKLKESCEVRVNGILNVLMSFAQLDYSRKIEISDERDFIDALGAGINMLGEELKGSTVSLHEKEVLLKEIHHRVKNNLQVISSLLNLQADQIDDISFKEKYRVSRDRIRSMALVHEKLYESENLSLIDFGDYVNSLANSLNMSYNPDNSRIDVKIEVGKNAGMFRIETAIPCGLILNEMLSNSFKYAFPGGQKGNVNVFFGNIGKKGEKPLFMLEVKDNGVGLPQDAKIESAETLGFQLISMLTDQLNGKLEVGREKGTSFSLTFTEQ